MTAWNLETFGPGARTEGIFDHIRKELKEILGDPTDITEWSDLLLLALNGAMRAGHEPQQIIDAIKAKQAINEQRTWPDWRTQDPNKAIEHVRLVDEPVNEPDTPAADRAQDECSNCDGRKCMDCVCRHYHDACVEDCPQCCPAPQPPQEHAVEPTRVQLLRLLIDELVAILTSNGGTMRRDDVAPEIIGRTGLSPSVVSYVINSAVADGRITSSLRTGMLQLVREPGAEPLRPDNGQSDNRERNR
ncbi:dATP/dGTP pyrophosphohydrolase domain-containing protein [Tsukamurella tyrosinosolvens]|nr:dATP/dGTP pyrophosphohydrolase domain-containing protein [Tsukamurella tyrosinosolvens]